LHCLGLLHQACHLTFVKHRVPLLVGKNRNR
jgi:hypothetical protein